MGFHQPPADQKPQSNSLNALGPAIPQTLERSKELIPVFGRYAYTLVADADNKMIRVRFGRNSYVAAVRRILNCVLQQIMQNTFQSHYTSARTGGSSLGKLMTNRCIEDLTDNGIKKGNPPH